jgi:DNA-directed RNA polymerase specialized sigma24 family protein
VLRDVHELSCEEIARIINCTNATTRWRLHKARELFKERWEKTVGRL